LASISFSPSGLGTTTVSGVVNLSSSAQADLDAGALCLPGIAEATLVTVSGAALASLVLTTTVPGGVYLVRVEPDSSGDQTFVLLKCGGDPTANSISLSSSDGPFSIRGSAASDIRVSGLNLLGSRTFNVRCVRVS
jgi:hypothetical protein